MDLDSQNDGLDQTETLELVLMQSAQLFSEHWYRVKDLKPRLAKDVETSRHVYRGVASYMLHRKSSNNVYRASAEAMELIGNFDGQHTVDELWTSALEWQGENAPTQAEFIDLLGQLHESEILIVDRRLNVEHLFSRGEDKSRKTFKQTYLNPLFVRFALLDPDKILTALYEKLSWLFNPWFAMAWIVLLLSALFQLIPSWSLFRFELATVELLSPFYALMFILIYPVMKLIHEFSHGLILKRFGGEVHEMGIALMVLLPIPYVDATTSALLPNKRDRILVSAGGILVELGLAALATLIWVNSSGLLHDVALVVMLIGGLSTVLFNANPLLKFDGYFILADYLELPNLAQRSKTYLQARLNRLLFKIDVEHYEPADAQEKGLLLSYGVLSCVYRVLLMLAIAWMLSKKYFFFGILLAMWILATTLLNPVWRFSKFILAQNSSKRSRALSVSVAIAMTFIAVFSLIPMPYNTFGKAVVWLPDSAIVRSASDCEVTKLLATPGSIVKAGDELFHCTNPELGTSISILQARLDEVNARSNGLGTHEQVEKLKLSAEANTIRSNFNRHQEKLKNQQIIAGATGVFVVTGQSQLLGRYFPQGEIAAYIVTPDSRTVRMAVEQNQIALIEHSVTNVELVFAENFDKGDIYESAVSAQTPKADRQLTSAALSTAGGGSLVADPAGDGTTVLEPVFDVELEWPENAPAVNVGSHVYVKLHHSPTTLSKRLLAGMKRAFLGGVGV